LVYFYVQEEKSNLCSSEIIYIGTITCDGYISVAGKCYNNKFHTPILFASFEIGLFSENNISITIKNLNKVPRLFIVYFFHFLTLKKKILYTLSNGYLFLNIDLKCYFYRIYLYRHILVTIKSTVFFSTVHFIV